VQKKELIRRAVKRINKNGQPANLCIFLTSNSFCIKLRVGLPTEFPSERIPRNGVEMICYHITSLPLSQAFISLCTVHCILHPTHASQLVIGGTKKDDSFRFAKHNSSSFSFRQRCGIPAKLPALSSCAE
jgi:hypothetical protein